MIGALGFLNPWVLAGLIFLPALWFLLRVTPPAPRLIKFPPARLLAGLKPDEQTVSHTPWWILLLRLLCAALIIVALARPLLNPAEALPGHGPLRILIDNGWAGAQTWNDQRDKAAGIIDRAGRENRPVYILTTAPEPDGALLAQKGPMAAGAAASIINGLKPYPWPADYTAVTKALDAGEKESIATYWLSTGLQDSDTSALAGQLQNQGELHVIEPEAVRLPLLLRPSRASGPEAKAAVEFPPGAARSLPVTVQALAADGRVLDAQTVTANKQESTATVKFDLPEQVRNTVGRIRIAGRRGAGAVLLLDDEFRRRQVGIAAPAGQENTAPLIESDFYIRHALEPYADVIAGTVKELLEKNPPVIVMPDIRALPTEELNALEKWVRDGGLLLRFAGPNMTEGENFLTPAPLRKGGRALSGAMTWNKPGHLAPFPKTSPYAGLSVPSDITVNQQLLAEPVDGIEKMTWAALEDGTPLITAAPLDRGLLVLIHTTATPQWSDLALSGLFVQILQRTVRLAGQGGSLTAANTGTLQPQLVLDGLGNPGRPGGFVQPIPAADLATAVPSPAHPPGLYGRPGFQAALNLGDHLLPLKVLGDMPVGVSRAFYGERSRETDLTPYFLTAAFALFLIDWLVMMILQSGLRLGRAATAAMVLLLLAAASPARAENADDAEKYAGSLYLAYVRTGLSGIDFQTYQGLNTLAGILTQRTSVDTAGVVPVDPEHDNLAFFPLIYWPVVPSAQPLSAQAAHNIQDYLDHGGTILFDTRDQNTSDTSGSTKSLHNITGALDIPPLAPLPKNHVLTKSFYLLKDFPARFDEGTLWVEESSAVGRDGVSSVIVGSHDWASDWAGAANNRSQNAEMGLRFGVNLVMYALTGNYKDDQVHIDAILQRLGE